MPSRKVEQLDETDVGGEFVPADRGFLEISAEEVEATPELQCLTGGRAPVTLRRITAKLSKLKPDGTGGNPSISVLFEIDPSASDAPLSPVFHYLMMPRQGDRPEFIQRQLRTLKHFCHKFQIDVNEFFPAVNAAFRSIEAGETPEVDLGEFSGGDGEVLLGYEPESDNGAFAEKNTVKSFK